MWNLWLRDQGTGVTRRIADVPCNQIEPAWENDSKTLLYGTDCGRSLWFTAVARRRVIPLKRLAGDVADSLMVRSPYSTSESS